VAGARPSGEEPPADPNEESNVVTLGEAGSDGGGFCGDRKIGSLPHEDLELGGGAGAGDGIGGELVGVDEAVLKTCVKLPSPEADPEVPGDENPFAREGFKAGGVAGRDASSVFLGEALDGGGAPPTKIRVNSPELRSVACSPCVWVGTGGVGAEGRNGVSPAGGEAGLTGGRESTF
jgi:hypothetical protein